MTTHQTPAEMAEEILDLMLAFRTADEWKAVRVAHLMLTERVDRLRAMAESAQQVEGLCPCKDRPASQCDEQWGPKCDLGNNPAFAKPAPPHLQDEPGTGAQGLSRSLSGKPDARQPLTECDINELIRKHAIGWCAGVGPREFTDIARAIERAHGIEGEA